MEPSDEQLTALFVRAERVARRVLGAADAEDVASEAIIRLVAAWPRVGPYAGAWVTRVAANLAVDSLRHARREPVGRSRPEAPFDDAVVDREVILGELRRLSRRQRQVVVLHHLVGLPDEEIAASLRVSVPTVRTHLARGMAALGRSAEPDTVEPTVPPAPRRPQRNGVTS